MIENNWWLGEYETRDAMSIPSQMPGLTKIMWLNNNILDGRMSVLVVHYWWFYLNLRMLPWSVIMPILCIDWNMQAVCHRIDDDVRCILSVYKIQMQRNQNETHPIINMLMLNRVILRTSMFIQHLCIYAIRRITLSSFHRVIPCTGSTNSVCTLYSLAHKFSNAHSEKRANVQSIKIQWFL